MHNKIKVIETCIQHLVDSRDNTFTSYSALRGYDLAIDDLRTFLIDEQERERQDYEDTESEYAFDKYYAEPSSDYKYNF